MIDVLYYICIYPLQSLLGAVFGKLEAAFGSGLGIITLSVLVNLCLLKLSFIADKKAKSITAIKLECDAKIAGFKRVFKGAELQAYIRTLYAQKHFHPIYMLSTLGGLALQVPFFIAVLCLFMGLESLHNAHFLWISDLSKPDSIFGIHLLPIVMTLFTLINVFCTSKERGARIQGSIIALIFLVFLYEMPSALVLYWTTNMAFALLKTLIIQRLDSRIQIDSSTTKSQTSSAIQAKDSALDSHVESQTIESSDIHNNTQKNHSLFSRLILALFPAYKELDSSQYRLYRNISIVAIIDMCFMICVFSPYAVYSSDVSQFDASQSLPTLSILFGIFLLSSFLIIYATSFLYHTRLLKLGVFAFLVLFLITISYTMIFTGNIFNGRPYAELDGLLFRDGGANISHPLAKYFDIGYGVFLMLLACILLCYAKKFVRIGLLFVMVAIMLASIFDTTKIIYNHGTLTTDTTQKHETKVEPTKSLIPDYVNPYLNFSKEKNILVLFSDTVQADNFTQILKDDPSLFDVFSGFTYYENSLSVANITFGSAPAISGGVYYHPNNINKRNLEHSLSEESSNAVLGVANSFANAGYKVSLGSIYPGDESIIRKKLHKDTFLIPNNDQDAWVDLYKQHYHIKDLDSKDSMPIGDLFSIGLFRASPYIFRGRIYQAEGWIFGDSLLYNHYRYSVKNVSKIASFSLVSQANETKPTFKFIHEEMEHFPWLLDKDNDCKPIDSASTYRSKMISAKDELAYSNHICYVRNLTKWLQWFKDNGIYDNTKIIIVSDHGNGGNGAPLIEFPRRELKNSHILLLVKDFNAKGKLKIDRETLVSNSDTMALACDEIGSICPNIAPSFLKNPNPNRELIFTLVDGGTGRASNNKYDIVMSYKVKKSIFDMANWSDITNDIKTTQQEH